VPAIQANPGWVIGRGGTPLLHCLSVPRDSFSDAAHETRAMINRAA